MKYLLIIFVGGLLTFCSEDTLKVNEPVHDLLDLKPDLSTSQDISIFKGIYQFQKHHGLLKLYIEDGYALFVDQGRIKEINKSFVGAIKLTESDTLKFEVNFEFDRPGMLDVNNPRHSSDWIDFYAYADSSRTKSNRQMKILPRISASDTTLELFMYNEHYIDLRKIK